MSFFGMGPTEFLVIAVIAFIIFGPEKFTELAGSVGKFVREFRAMSGGLTGEFQQAFNEIQQVGGELRQVGDELQDSTRSLLNDVDLRNSMPRSIGEPAPAPAFVRSANVTVSSRPTKADPLADFGTVEAMPVTPPAPEQPEVVEAPEVETVAAVDEHTSEPAA